MSLKMSRKTREGVDWYVFGPHAVQKEGYLIKGRIKFDGDWVNRTRIEVPRHVFDLNTPAGKSLGRDGDGKAVIWRMTDMWDPKYRPDFGRGRVYYESEASGRTIVRFNIVKGPSSANLLTKPQFMNTRFFNKFFMIGTSGTAGKTQSEYLRMYPKIPFLDTLNKTP